MKNFKTKHSNREAAISTAALPDIIFMLLFFFMVTTVLRKSDDNLKYKIPTAEQLKEIQTKSLISQINIGMPRDTEKIWVRAQDRSGRQTDRCKRYRPIHHERKG
jgi:biopolymer transport protein ExbD